MPRIREVAAKTRLLIEEFRKDGISETEITLGLMMAVQAAPVTKALADNPEVKEFLTKAGNFVRAGAALLDEFKEKKED